MMSAKQVPRAFGSLFHTLIRAGERDGDFIAISKKVLVNYSSRIFDLKAALLTESLAVLKAVDLVKDSGDDYVFSDVERLEEFFEYYQYFFYKEDQRHALDVNPVVIQCLEVVQQGGEGELIKLAPQTLIEKGVMLDKNLISELKLRGLALKKDSGSLVFHRQEVVRLLVFSKMIQKLELPAKAAA